MSTRSSHKPLLLSSNELVHGSYSSYSMLAQYLTRGEAVLTTRRENHPFYLKAINRLIRLFATSNWYQLNSAALELRAWHKSRKYGYTPIHILWGERDLGYLDRFTHRSVNPLCCTFHACSDDLPRILVNVESLKRLAAIIIVSETQRSFFEACGVDRQRIHYIPHGIDTNYFTPAQAESDRSKFTLLAVGNYRRDFPLLRSIFQQLEKFKHIQIKVVSSPKNHHHFAELKNVKRLSHLSDAELLEVYQSASGQIIAVENATANNALLEGLACGLPTIAGDVGGIREYLNLDCALLIQPQDIEGFVQAVVDLADDSIRRTEMAKAARQRALELQWSNIAEQTEQLYQSLLAKG
jgi:glycosyltransferase involved in cell wall biosynthesis